MDERGIGSLKADGALVARPTDLLLGVVWEASSTAPGRIAGIEACDAIGDWIAAPVPGTAAEALHGAGRWNLRERRDFDAEEWWYRCRFTAQAHATADHVLVCEGLATLADVWLNGALVLQSTNMFQRHEIPVSASLTDGDNTLVIRFRSLNAALLEKRPRPRWKTRLVAHQQLRWFRTSLLGRIPGWSPPVAPVGPWRPVRLEARPDACVSSVSLRPFVDDGGVPTVEVDFAIKGTEHLIRGIKCSVPLISASEWTLLEATPTGEGGAWRARGLLRVPGAERWWPHTHGKPALYDVVLATGGPEGDERLTLGRVGFRRVEVLQEDGDFQLEVNGVSVFCRGACWTTTDIVGLRGSTAAMERGLRLLRDAGGNMVRISGTMVYERDEFYALCDALGIMVWQDFMFANMDYPAHDVTFAGSVHSEATQQVRRLRRFASLVVYCGNSEVEQQAAMVGTPRELWRTDLFARVLPAICAAHHPDAVYVPSTPIGGALPFRTDAGLTHYYGVGAYMRPLSDARAAQVRFTPECLGFANVPEPEVVAEVMQGDAPATHDPRWKERTPRDTGAGWDFEDVRDHYVASLFGVDPGELRRVDTQRYMELSRLATGEVMARVFAEWRRTGSSCHGALVWFWRDLWPGAGWGVLDAHGDPKPCYWYLKRAWQPAAVLITDEGLNGALAHVVNERETALDARIEIMLLRENGTLVARGESSLVIPARGSAEVDVESVLGGFYDVAAAYRFGPPAFDAIAARVHVAHGMCLGQTIHWPRQLPARAGSGALAARASHGPNGEWLLNVTCDSVAYGVRIDVPGFEPSDNYFAVLPGSAAVVTLRATTDAVDPPAGVVEALNVSRAARIELAS